MLTPVPTITRRWVRPTPTPRPTTDRYPIPGVSPSGPVKSLHPPYRCFSGTPLLNAYPTGTLTPSQTQSPPLTQRPSSTATSGQARRRRPTHPPPALASHSTSTTASSTGTSVPATPPPVPTDEYLRPAHRHRGSDEYTQSHRRPPNRPILHPPTLRADAATDLRRYTRRLN